MTDVSVVETLAEEFSVDKEIAQRIYTMLEAGLKIPAIARYRRKEIGPFTDGTLRGFVRRMHQLQELAKRRENLLKSIEEQKKALTTEEAASASNPSVDALRKCMDRLELEDLFLPHRRPEPEVQLAIDHGLEALASLLTAPGPKPSAKQPSTEEAPAQEGSTEYQGPEDVAESPEDPASTEDSAPEAGHPTEEGSPEPAAAAEESAEPDAEQAAEPVAEPVIEMPAEPVVEPSAESVTETPAEPAVEQSIQQVEVAVEAPPPTGGERGAKPKRKRKKRSEPTTEPPVHGLHIDVTLELARACAAFVNPDRGVHTDQEALEGAVRILSDRLGRSPSLRSTLRRTLRKHGRIKLRALVPDKELGRHRALLKLNTPIRQLQGHRLLELRQAQAQRHVAMMITVEEKFILPKVKQALGKRIKPEFESLANAVAEQALRQRLLPMIEDEVRNELRERADEEALRFLAQHLRQILLASPIGPRPVAGVHIDAKGDWLVVGLDRDGQPVGEELKLEAGASLPRDLATSLGEALRSSGVRALAVANGKSIREGVRKLRETIHLIKADACVHLVNEAGLSNYANSEIARQELAGFSVPARQAVSLGRRLQDPLQELLKADPRHLGLGREQSIVSKANLRRMLHDTLESSVAFIGCDLNSAPLSYLRYIPGLNFDLAKKLVERRQERPFSSREELRTEGLLDDVAWTNSIGFLRVDSSTEPLDRTALHPEQYDIVRRMILDGGRGVEETLGQRDALRGLRAKNYDLDEYTWRDMQREVSHPGRDPRSRLSTPQLLDPETDVKTLEKGQVVEGIVSNVTSFGAFIDLGVPRDGMIHISEISIRYVRDARALLSIGQIVRARVLDSSGPRVELSLKNVPDNRSRSDGNRGNRSGGGRPPQGGRSGRGRDGGKKEAWPEYVPVRRAANSRRDGLVTGSSKESRGGGRGRPGGGQGRGQGRGPGRGGDRRKKGDEQYDPSAVREASRESEAYNPFANFFKDKGEDGE